MKNSSVPTGRISIITLMAYALAVFMLFSFFSCSSWTAINSNLASKLGNDIYNVQFKTSSDFGLSRSAENENKFEVTKKGKIVIKGGQSSQNIFFPRHTDCKAMSSSGNLLFMQLEKPDSNLTLNFGPNAATFNRFTLMFQHDTKHTEHEGTVTYGGKSFTATFDQIPYLLVNKKVVKAIEKESRIAKGVKVTKIKKTPKDKKEKDKREDEEDY